MKAIINNKEFLIKKDDSRPFRFKVNSKSIELDAYTNPDGVLYFLYHNRSYRSELISYNKLDKLAVIRLNNKRFEIVLMDESDLLLEQLRINDKTNKAHPIKAPMPGLVLSINIQEGDRVNKGDGLLVLEAMKMENLIKAHASGKVKKIHVIKGAKVEKNQPLIEME